MKVHIVSYTDLMPFATDYSHKLKKGDVVKLYGEIGAGKTTFLRHLVQALGYDIKKGYSSPTFTILNQYSLDGAIINHIDMYRLDSFEDLEHIDLIKQLEDDQAYTFVEWGDKFKELENYYTKRIYFEYIENEPTKRKITVL